MQYIIVKIEYMTKDIVINQLNALKRGFNKLIPESKTSSLTPEEFEKILCGNTFIDLKDWRK